jgi:hypothetical protein
MRCRRKVVFLHFALLSIGAVGYSQDAAAVSSALSGNWRIAGNEDAASPQYPALTISFAVDGTNVYGGGTSEFLCNGKGQTLAFKVEGTISSDGNFSVKEPAGDISIRGTVPAAGGTEWSGSFRINPLTNDPKTGARCPSVSEVFVAKKLNPIVGRYLGALRLDGRSALSDGTVSMDLTQGLLANDGHELYVPLHAVVILKDSAKFPSGTWTTDENPAGLNRVEGNQFSITYFAADGSALADDGKFDNDDMSQLRTVSFTYWPRGLDKDPRVEGFATLERQEN